MKAEKHEGVRLDRRNACVLREFQPSHVLVVSPVIGHPSTHHTVVTP